MLNQLKEVVTDLTRTIVEKIVKARKAKNPEALERLEEDIYAYSYCAKKLAFILHPDLIGKEDSLITVCASCLRACCWQGTYLCDHAQNADIVELPISLLTTMDLEHSDYWKKQN